MLLRTFKLLSQALEAWPPSPGDVIVISSLSHLELDCGVECSNTNKFMQNSYNWTFQDALRCICRQRRLVRQEEPYELEARRTSFPFSRVERDRRCDSGLNAQPEPVNICETFFETSWNLHPDLKSLEYRAFIAPRIPVDMTIHFSQNLKHE